MPPEDNESDFQRRIDEEAWQLAKEQASLDLGDDPPLLSKRVPVSAPQSHSAPIDRGEVRSLNASPVASPVSSPKAKRAHVDTSGDSARTACGTKSIVFSPAPALPPAPLAPPRSYCAVAQPYTAHSPVFPSTFAATPWPHAPVAAHPGLVAGHYTPVSPAYPPGPPGIYTPVLTPSDFEFCLSSALELVNRDPDFRQRFHVSLRQILPFAPAPPVPAPAPVPPPVPPSSAPGE